MAPSAEREALARAYESAGDDRFEAAAAGHTVAERLSNPAVESGD